MIALPDKPHFLKIFEKYSTRSTSYAGGGGEYEVQVGFGWTNGVALWTAATFGDVLELPECQTLQRSVLESSQGYFEVKETGLQAVSKWNWRNFGTLMGLQRLFPSLFI